MLSDRVSICFVSFSDNLKTSENQEAKDSTGGSGPWFLLRWVWGGCPPCGEVLGGLHCHHQQNPPRGPEAKSGTHSDRRVSGVGWGSHRYLQSAEDAVCEERRLLLREEKSDDGQLESEHSVGGASPGRADRRTQTKPEYGVDWLED